MGTGMFLGSVSGGAETPTMPVAGHQRPYYLTCYAAERCYRKCQTEYCTILTSARRTLPRPALWPSSQSIVYARGEALPLSLPRSLPQTHVKQPLDPGYDRQD
jgi:hypothetical protein